MVEDAVSGAEIAAAPCLPALALSVAHLPLPLGREGPILQLARTPLIFTHLLFCECTRGDCAVLEPFSGKLFFFFFFCLSGDPMLQSHVSSLRLSSGHSGPFLTLRTDDAVQSSLPSPHSGGRRKHLGCCDAGSCGQVCILWGSFFFFSPSYVALLDYKIPHRPTCERVSYCVETSPPSHSLLKSGLHP